jgi:hypothetical protein
MRVRIDKPGHDDTTARIYDFTFSGDQGFDFAPPADSFDELAAHQERAIFDDRELSQIATRARAMRAREGDEL